jgi:sugar lactone lactonase YvrE
MLLTRAAQPLCRLLHFPPLAATAAAAAPRTRAAPFPRRTFAHMAAAAPPVIISGARVEPVWTPSHELGEGAIWNESLQAYMHVDIYGPSRHCAGPAVYVHNPYAGNAFKCYPMPSFTGTVVPRAGGGAVVALKDGLATLDLDTGVVTPLANPEANGETRWNDGKASPEGRLWAGTMGVPGKVLPRLGSLYVLHVDGSTARAVGDVTISNGLAWSGDGRTMYYIDTPTGGVDAFDYDPATGALANRRTAFAIPPGTGHPDGCCMDASGNLWVAQWGGSRVVAYSPGEGGRVVAEVHLPTAQVSSVTFGGPGLTDLYITTAKEHLTPEQRAEQPHAGDIFMVRDVGWTGVPACVFRG